MTWVAPNGDERTLVAVGSADAADTYLRTQPVDLVVIDTRAVAGEDSLGGPFGETRAGKVLAALFQERAFSDPVVRDNVVGVVGHGPAATTAAYRFGRAGVADVLVAPSDDALIERINTHLRTRARGRIAICLAGGGVEGIFYEIGVLRALDAFMANRSVVDVDLFCGISAGAILGAFLANGLGPDEIGRGLAGESARIDPISRFMIFEPNLREIAFRGGRLGAQLLRGGWGPRGALSSMARAIPSAAFSGEGARKWLEGQLTKSGMTNRFSELRRPLFVGATDQDTSEAVVFGEPPLDEIPIDRAVRASSALVPFYPPELIDGRYYVDGAFTRTTNMRVAQRKGASLVLLIDPLVPVRSTSPGYVYRRGGVFGTLQALKSLINQRFDKASVAIRQMFPDVTFHLFRPEGDEMRVLSGSPMKYFFRREIEEIAFQHTVRKLQENLPELARDFGRHGVRFRDPSDRATSTRPPPISPERLGVGA